jgi:hypothetical protein
VLPVKRGRKNCARGLITSFKNCRGFLARIILNCYDENNRVWPPECIHVLQIDLCVRVVWEESTRTGGGASCKKRKTKLRKRTDLVLQELFEAFGIHLVVAAQESNYGYFDDI